MRIFFYGAFILLIGVAIFAVQNSSANPVTIKFLIWRFETSLIYTILGSILLGVLFTLLLWIPRALRNSFQSPKVQEDL
jgi:lipopolysaccharide assembly protein A